MKRFSALLYPHARARSMDAFLPVFCCVLCAAACSPLPSNFSVPDRLRISALAVSGLDVLCTKLASKRLNGVAIRALDDKNSVQAVSVTRQTPASEGGYPALSAAQRAEGYGVLVYRAYIYIVHPPDTHPAKGDGAPCRVDSPRSV